MAKLKGKFSEGGLTKGYIVSDLEILYDQMAGFAEYGFNAGAIDSVVVFTHFNSPQFPQSSLRQFISCTRLGHAFPSSVQAPLTA